MTVALLAIIIRPGGDEFYFHLVGLWNRKLSQ